jgi:hypothetical protein
MRRSAIPPILATVLLAPAICADPPPRRVVTDVRITSVRVTGALPQTARDRLRKRVAQSLADMAKAEFRYLEWAPKSAADPAGAPTLALEVFDEAPPATSPCNAKVRWRLVAELKSQNVYSSPPEDLDNGCNPRPLFQNEGDFESQLTTLDGVRRIFKANPNEIQVKLLRLVPLVSRLEADQGARKLLLPLAEDQLLADTASKLRVDFKVDQNRGKMELQPWEPAGDRMQVQIYVLSCGNITAPCANLTDASGTKWLPALPALLGRCSDLGVFMDTYLPAPAGTRGETQTSLGSTP